MPLHRVLALLAALTLVGGSAAAQDRYPPPASQAEVLEWARDHVTLAMRPGDPYSPRAYTAVTGPQYGAVDARSAIADLVRDTGIDFAETPGLEPLEAWRTWDGSTAWLVLTETRLSGAPGVLFLIGKQEAGSDQFTMFGVETTRDTFVAWGGIPRMMVLRELIPNVEVFPPERREQIATAPFENQVAVYEAALDHLLEDIAAALTMMNQAQVTLRMQEFNYDLLLGHDITSPGISD